jgi:hypothetical protein
MLTAENFTKVTLIQRSLFPVDEKQSYLVSIKMNDNQTLPAWIQKDKIRPVLDGYVEPNFYSVEMKGFNLLQLDNEDSVMTWGLVRKTGSIEFTDEQIWEAFKQLESEFFRHSTPKHATAEIFKHKDSIGYEECMSAMERILYKAVGYI